MKGVSVYKVNNYSCFYYHFAYASGSEKYCHGSYRTLTDLSDTWTACAVIQIHLKHENHKWQHKLQQKLGI